MSVESEILVQLTQQAGYAFLIDFGEDLPELVSDEAAPLGAGQGPNPSRLLLAALANCLAASLVFALHKFKNQPAPVRAEIRAQPERNADGRWRIPRASVTIRLAEGAEQHQNLRRVLDQFEQFCLVTQSVREGIAVDVTVHDSGGELLHRSASEA